MGIGTAIVGGALIGGIASSSSASKAASASKSAANTAASAQMAQLDYLKQVNELPQQYKEQALTKLDATFNPETGQYEFPQEQLVSQAQESPLYNALMGAQPLGEEAIMRNAGATGGLRSGDLQGNLYDYNTQLQNNALLQSYNNELQQYQYGMSGLKGLAQLPTNEGQIGQVTANIGQTQAAGITAAGQAQQAGIQGVGNAVGTGLSQYLWASGQGLI